MRPGTPDLVTEWERQLTTARANQTTSLTNGRAANWTQEVALVLSARFPVFVHILKVFLFILFSTVATKVFQQTGLLQHVS